MSEYSQGVCDDGAAILCNGQPITIEEILNGLRQRDELLAALKTAKRTARLMHTAEQHETVCIEPQHWRLIIGLIAKYEAKS